MRLPVFSHRTPRVHKANCKTSYLRAVIQPRSGGYIYVQLTMATVVMMCTVVMTTFSSLEHLVKTVCSDSFTPSRYCRTSGQRDDLMWEPWQLLLGTLSFGMKLYNGKFSHFLPFKCTRKVARYNSYQMGLPEP